MGKFVVSKDKAGEYRVALKAGNGETIAVSGEGFKTKASAMNNIKSVQTNAAGAVIEDKSEAAAK
ncbi:MAG: DUF1508 domain-containing protein [Streptosporangiaceae bacterium]